MYILKKKSNSTQIYYLCKSFWNANTKKNSTKIIEKIGTEEEIRAKYGQDIDLKEWLKNYAKDKTNAEKTNKVNLNLELNGEKKLPKEEQRIYNGGYFALQKICYKLKIDEICKSLCKKTKTNIDLTGILTTLVYDRIINPYDDNSYSSFTKTIIENKDFAAKDCNLALKIIAENYDYIQYALFMNAKELFPIDVSMIFNECIHYCFDINQYESKKNKNVYTNSSLNVVQVDLFYDKYGIPLAFSNNTYKNKYYTQNPIIDAIDYWKDKSQIISFSDNLPSQLINDIKDKFKDVYEIKNLNIRLLKKHLREWVLNKNGWHAWGTDKIYDLDKVNSLIFDNKISAKERKKLELIVFYKYCKLPTENTNKHNNLVVGFSYLAKKEDRLIRNGRYERIKQILDKQIVDQYEKNPEACQEFFIKFKKFLKGNLSEEGKMDSFFYDFDTDMVNEENTYDGFFACLVDPKIKNISDVVHNRYNSWLIDCIFNTVKREFRVIPHDVSKYETINAHLSISYISLLVLKILQGYIKERFNLENIREEMLKHNYIKIPGKGWCPIFKPSDITDALDKICDIESDWEFISDKSMKEIIKKTKTIKS